MLTLSRFRSARTNLTVILQIDVPDASSEMHPRATIYEQVWAHRSYQFASKRCNRLRMHFARISTPGRVSSGGRVPVWQGCTGASACMYQDPRHRNAKRKREPGAQQGVAPFNRMTGTVYDPLSRAVALYAVWTVESKYDTYTLRKLVDSVLPFHVQEILHGLIAYLEPPQLHRPTPSPALQTRCLGRTLLPQSSHSALQTANDTGCSTSVR